MKRQDWETCTMVAQPVAFSSKDYGADAANDMAPTLRAMGHAGSHANGGGQVAVAFAIQAGALRTNPASGPDGVGVQADHAYTLEARAEVQAVCVTGDVFHTLRAEGFDASEDGTGRGAGAVAVALRGREGGATAEVGDDCAFTLRASTGGGDKPHVLGPAAVAVDTYNHTITGDYAGSITTTGGPPLSGPGVLHGMAVRRLTPRECERLQGFPDDYTAIPWKRKPAGECPDGPRYKALGNSWVVPVVRWIGARIAAAQSALEQA